MSSSLNARNPNLLVTVIVYYLVTSVGALALGMVQPLLGIPEVVIQISQFGPTLGVLAIIVMTSRRTRPPITLKLHLNPLEPPVCSRLRCSLSWRSPSLGSGTA